MEISPKKKKKKHREGEEEISMEDVKCCQGIQEKLRQEDGAEVKT